MRSSLRRLGCGASRRGRRVAQLSFHGGLHDQAHAQAGDLLQNLAEVSLGGEQLVDLGADTLDSG
jgi:hypothetical protein